MDLMIHACDAMMHIRLCLQYAQRVEAMSAELSTQQAAAVELRAALSLRTEAERALQNRLAAVTADLQLVTSKVRLCIVQEPHTHKHLVTHVQTQAQTEA